MSLEPGSLQEARSPLASRMAHRMYRNSDYPWRHLLELVRIPLVRLTIILLCTALFLITHSAETMPEIPMALLLVLK